MKPSYENNAYTRKARLVLSLNITLWAERGFDVHIPSDGNVKGEININNQVISGYNGKVEKKVSI